MNKNVINCGREGGVGVGWLAKIYRKMKCVLHFFYHTFIENKCTLFQEPLKLSSNRKINCAIGYMRMQMYFTNINGRVNQLKFQCFSAENEK